jgi:nucleoside-diphosphate-sugar epimerase
MSTILITGSSGQIGSELADTLSQAGQERIICTDVREGKNPLPEGTVFIKLDITQKDRLEEVFRKQDIHRIYHLAAILSAKAEDHPGRAWEVNMNGLHNMLELAREKGSSIFVPSSIAAFGPDTPRQQTPQDTLQRATSLYGITKVAGELLCDYYYQRYKLDTRGVRYPGLISYKTEPGGGTTDYAVDIFFSAVRKRKYSCFLKPDTRLDMMYMPDAISAMTRLMDADPSRLKHRNAFNIAAYSITPEELAGEIRKHIPGFTISYDIDPVRQAIADSWPESMDDSAAREEWDWNPRYSLGEMVADMLANIRKIPG